MVLGGVFGLGDMLPAHFLTFCMPLRQQPVCPSFHAKHIPENILRQLAISFR